MNPCSIARSDVISQISPYSVSENAYTWNGATNAWDLYHSQTVYSDEGHSGRNWLEPFIIGQNISDPQLDARLHSLYPNPSGLQSAKDQVLLAAFSKASESKALMLVTLAEAKKTAAALDDAFDLLKHVYTFAKRHKRDTLKPKNLWKLSSSAASAWLQYRYAFSPLIGEIKTYTDIIGGKGLNTRMRFTSRKTLSDPAVSTDSGFGSLGNYIEQGTLSNRSRIDELSAGCLVNVSGGASALSELGADRLLSTAWELVPFSFIADWFVNVSEFIAAREGRFSQEVLGSWATQYTRCHGVHQLVTKGRSWVLGGSTKYVGSATRNYTVTENLKWLRRSSYPPMPALPVFEIKSNWKRMLDLATIARGMKVR